MSAELTTIQVKNYRSLADVTLDVNSVNVLFGPNGVGKSTLLDTVWFFRDCAIRGVELASSARSHGIGILWDGAKEGDQILISLATPDIEYELRFGLSSGRIEQFAGERLRDRTNGRVLIDRPVSSDKAQLFHEEIGSSVLAPLREPEKISLGLYLAFNRGDRAAGELDWLLRSVRHYHSRSFFLHRLKTQGSEANYEIRLWERGDNLWSVLRNLHDKRSIDDRYDTVMKWMKQAFPSFDGLVLEQTGPESVYASFQEKHRRSLIRASGVSDGHLQMLLLLTALFSEGRERSLILLFDEPEVSLHPWALAVFARAVKAAADEWRKQSIIATHSPVLLSQFDTHQILAANVADGRTHLRRLSEMNEIKDLLDNYATGSLYMSQLVGAQASETLEPVK
ncbi:MAG: AAA family ATPase [Planctomycetia bacterium]|nr:AAA family ATPase [Planctomycetia bacterium]